MSGHLWRLISVAGSAIAVGLLIGAAGADADGFFGQTPAAWVQALGSIAAILGAIWIAGEQSRRDDRKRIADREEAEFKRMVEALETITMLVLVAERARDMAKMLSTHLKSNTSLKADYIRVYAPQFSEMRADVDGLLGLQQPGSGVRGMAFNFRNAIGHMAFAMSGTLAAIDLGHAPGPEDFKVVYSALDADVVKIEEHIGLDKVMIEVWREEKLKEDQRRKATSR